MKIEELVKRIHNGQFHRESTPFLKRIIALMPDYVFRNSYLATYKKGEIVVHKGDPLRFVFITVSGDITVVNEFESGKVYEPVVLPHSDFVVVVEALLNYEEIISTNIATSDSEIIKIPIQLFKRWINESHDLTKEVLLNVSKNFVKNMRESGEGVLLNSKYLFIMHLLNQSKQKHGYHILDETREKTAKRTGINIRTLYRYIKEFKEKDLIDINGRSIIFSDAMREQLHQCALELRNR
jgi:CRP-like cAMP-binding protein